MIVTFFCLKHVKAIFPIFSPSNSPCALPAAFAEEKEAFFAASHRRLQEDVATEDVVDIQYSNLAVLGGELPRNRKRVSSPQFFEWIKPTKIPWT